VVRRTITLLIVTVGWVVFRSEDISQAIGFVKAMFTVTDLPISYTLSLALNYRDLIFLLAALPVFLLPGNFSGIKILISQKRPIPYFAGALMIFVLFPYCAALIMGGSSSPFIYFRF
jgi:alginate O-acetyltransferase complex protein AlgI